jgi:hypothetical protein
MKNRRSGTARCDPRMLPWSAVSAFPDSRGIQKSGFLPLCPEFVIKTQCPSDSLPQLKHKMPIWPPSGPVSKNVKNRPGTSFTPAESYN